MEVEVEYSVEDEYSVEVKYRSQVERFPLFLVELVQTVVPYDPSVQILTTYSPLYNICTLTRGTSHRTFLINSPSNWGNNPNVQYKCTM